MSDDDQPPDAISFTIRLPKDIAQALSDEAKACGWPISTEILMRLQYDFIINFVHKTMEMRVGERKG